MIQGGIREILPSYASDAPLRARIKLLSLVAGLHGYLSQEGLTYNALIKSML